MYPVTVTVEWQVGEQQWRLDGPDGPWRGPDGGEVGPPWVAGILDSISGWALGLKAAGGSARAGT